MSQLFQSIHFRDLRLKNRVVVSPMCQYSGKDGFVQPWHLVHLGARAAGGAGLVIIEATGVDPAGRITPFCLGLWRDEQADALKPIVDFAHSQGAAIGIQLAHAGRKGSCLPPFQGGKPILDSASGGWPVIGPSAIPFSQAHGTPKAMTTEDIKSLTMQFAAATERAHRANLDVIELHMAHGYLLHSFLSPLSNQRADQYGGSLENRMRFPLEVAKAVRDVWPQSKPLFVRISCSDWVPGGWDLAQSVAFSAELKKLGVDLIDCSSGGSSPTQQIPVGPGYQVHFAAEIRRKCQISTGAVGLVTRVHQAEEVLSSGSADLVLLGRQLLREPSWPLRAAAELGDKVAWPVQYLLARQ